MSGRRVIDPKVHVKIRKLARAGETQTAIQRLIGCSRYTVRVALNPAFRAQEAERHRTVYPDRHASRVDDPGYINYRAAYFDTDSYRAAVRARMRKKRHAEKPSR